jgi:small conductance mechanosensitive channel
VEIAGQAGTVQEINMTYTKLSTPDNKDISIPNSAVVAAQITNYSAQETRRISVDVCTGFDEPTQKVIDALIQAGTVDKVMLDPAPDAVISSYGEGAIQYSLRVWTKSEDYWNVYFLINRNIRDIFEAQGIKMAYPHMHVYMEQ